MLADQCSRVLYNHGLWHRWDVFFKGYTWNWVWADTLLNQWMHLMFHSRNPFCSSWPVLYAGSSVGASCCRIKEVHFGLIIKLKMWMVVRYPYCMYLCNSRCWSKSICRAFLLSGSIVILFSSLSIKQLSHLANLFSCNNTHIFITEADVPYVVLAILTKCLNT